MKGFMAGFGNAFSKSYENARDRRFQSEEREKQRQYEEKQDAFRMYYNTFAENQKLMREKEREDAKRVRDSETIAQVTGYDSRAVHSLLSADYTPQQIMQMYENGAEIEDIIEPQEQKPEQQPTNNANTQTSQVFGNDPMANNPNQEEFIKKISSGTGLREDKVREVAQFNPNDDNSKKSRNLDIRWKLPRKQGKTTEGPSSVADLVRGIAEARRDNNLELEAFYTNQLQELKKATVSESTNRPNSVAEYISVINDPNSTPEQVEWANRALEQQRRVEDENRARDIRTNLELRGDIPPQGMGIAVVDTPEGKKTMPMNQVPEGSKYRLQSPAEVKLIEDIEDKYREPALKVQEKVVKYNQSKEVIQEIHEILDVDPDVAGWGGTLSATTSNLVKNAAGLLESTGMIIDAVERGEEDYYNGVQTLEQAANDIRNLIPQGSPTEKQALNQALFEINKRRLAYLMAAQEGQTGIGLAQKEFEQFYKNIGNTASSVKQNTQSWLTRTERGLVKEVDAINNNSKSRRFFETYGYKPSDLVEFDSNEREIQTNKNPTQPAKDLQRMPSGSEKEQDAWYDKLPIGTEFLGPDGDIYTKEKEN